MLPTCRAILVPLQVETEEVGSASSTKLLPYVWPPGKPLLMQQNRLGDFLHQNNSTKYPAYLEIHLDIQELEEVLVWQEFFLIKIVDMLRFDTVFDDQRIQLYKTQQEEYFILSCRSPQSI